MFYLTTHSTHFIYGYMAPDTWLRTILIVRKETRCSYIGYSFRLAVRVLLYAPSHRQDITYHGLCYTSCGALAGTRNSSMGPPHEGSMTHRTMSERSYHGATSRSHITKMKMLYFSYKIAIIVSPIHPPRQNRTYHSFSYTSPWALAGIRNSSLGPS